MGFTKHLIYTTKASATAEHLLIEEAVKPLHNSGTTKYSSIVKHPTKQLWAIRIITSGKYYAKVSEIIDNRKLTTITADWLQNDLII